RQQRQSRSGDHGFGLLVAASRLEINRRRTRPVVRVRRLYFSAANAFTGGKTRLVPYGGSPYNPPPDDGLLRGLRSSAGSIACSVRRTVHHRARFAIAIALPPQSTNASFPGTVCRGTNDTPGRASPCAKLPS